MAITIDDLKFDITELDPKRVRIVVLLEDIELGVLYFERAKVGFTNKPIGLNSWACVEAKVEELYVYGGDTITPKDIVARCQAVLRSYF
jgi:hemolysin-activating ACP:hemolysin acyltransferase